VEKGSRSELIRCFLEIFQGCSSDFVVQSGKRHRLENPGKVTLEVIEVQLGEYLEEDDIVRFEDDFGRE